MTNKAAKSNKGCLVAMIKGTDSNRIKLILLRKIPLAKRKAVKEVTLGMADSIEQIVRKTFTNASLVTDWFHVQKLAYNAVQQMRIEYRWQAMEQKKKIGKAFVAEKLENGDSRKQLLARSRHLLFKRKDCWTSSQLHRAEILVRLYSQLEQAYNLSQQLSKIYQGVKDKGVAYAKLAKW